MNQPTDYNRMKMEACAVLYVKFQDDNVRTFYSRDVAKKPGNLHYWFNHLRTLAETKWPGMVKEFAIYRVAGGNRVGDPILKVSSMGEITQNP